MKNLPSILIGFVAGIVVTGILGWIMAIELGDFTLRSVIPLDEIIWLIAGLLLLSGLSVFVFWWSRHARPDPFL